MRTLLLAGGLALALGSAAAGQETASTPPGMSGACLAALVPAGAACQVVGTATAVGSFCVRIYDASGTVVGPQTFTIDVFHQ